MTLNDIQKQKISLEGFMQGYNSALEWVVQELAKEQQAKAEKPANAPISKSQ